MYEIYEGIKVELNRVTPYSIKKYQETLKAEGSKSTQNIVDIVKEELPKHLEDGAITDTKITEMFAKAVNQNVIASLDIYCNETFFNDWRDVIFKVTDEQKKLMTDFDNKFSVDEFMRGYSDFFGRLRGVSH